MSKANLLSKLSSLTGIVKLTSGDPSVIASGTDLKTVNSTSIIGSGDIAVQATLVSGTNIKTLNSTSLLGSGDIKMFSKAKILFLGD